MNAAISESRDRIKVTEHSIENSAYTKYPGNYTSYNDEWNESEFKNKFRAEIIEIEDECLEIDLIGVGPAIVNAYRRIMIAEVPTMAIELCFINNNTSVLQDEMLAHRLGLIPLRIDHKLFEWRGFADRSLTVDPKRTIAFELKAKCEKIPNVKSARREDLYKDYKIFSSHLKYQPNSKQLSLIDPLTEIRPVNEDILIAKLSGNQEIDVKLHAVKGIGRDHTKFSPVATASYRLMPDIQLLETIEGDLAVELKKSFTDGVIHIDERTKRARVVNSRIDTGSRNVFRIPDLKDKVRYDLIKDHFIFRIESTGCVPALDILLESCDILETKCEYFLKELKSYRQGVNKSTTMVESV